MLALQDQHDVIRPAAFAPEQAAAQIVAALRRHDVANNGLWRATVSHWERYDRPWLDAHNPGESKLIGSVSVMYDRPWKHQIVVYRVRTTVHGLTYGWNAELLVDDAFAFAGLTLANAPRTDMEAPPAPDPFRARRNPEYPVADGD